MNSKVTSNEPAYRLWRIRSEVSDLKLFWKVTCHVHTYEPGHCRQIRLTHIPTDLIILFLRFGRVQHNNISTSSMNVKASLDCKNSNSLSRLEDLANSSGPDEPQPALVVSVVG